MVVGEHRVYADPFTPLHFPLCASFHHPPKQPARTIRQHPTSPTTPVMLLTVPWAQQSVPGTPEVLLHCCLQAGGPQGLGMMIAGTRQGRQG